MTHFASLCRIAVAAAVSLVLASACGGNSFSNGGGDGGDSGSGGTQNHAGTHSTAGKSTAGSSSGGTGSGGTGTAGSGTGGSSPGGAPNYDACKAPTDCVVTSAGCCGVCDGPDVSRRDLIAYNRQYQGQISTCDAGDVACGACPEPVPGQGTLMYFVPNCVQGQCVVEDIRTSPVTACEDASECRLRNGTGCCEGCGGETVVSVRNDGSFEDLVCGGVAQPCPACIALPPDDAVAVCTEGRCGIEYLPIGAK
jgi:hypothetical protein